jgi:hypothetical protein
VGASHWLKLLRSQQASELIHTGTSLLGYRISRERQKIDLKSKQRRTRIQVLKNIV